jgi:hypothetical protein
MLNDNKGPNWTARIALLAVIPVLAGGLWLFSRANRDTPSTASVTSCSGFAVDAGKLFDNGDVAALSGTFAPGDRVRLAIDSVSEGYSWELTGVLGKVKKVDITGPARFRNGTKSTTHVSLITSRSTTSNTAYGDIISGAGRLNLEIDVTTAGGGAIAFKRAGSAPSSSLPRVASASCSAATGPTA